LVVSTGLYVAARTTVVPGGVRAASGEVRSGLIATAASVLVAGPLLTALPGWWSLLIAAPLIVLNQIIRGQKHYERWLVTEPTTELLSHKGFATKVRAITTGHPRAMQGPQPFGIILINLESMQSISRTLGRELHEKVISVVSGRLIAAYGPERASLLSGQEVAVVVPGLTESQAIGATQEAVALLSPIINVDDIPFALDPAGGAALSPRHGLDIDVLLMKAELAANESRRKRRRATVYVEDTAQLTWHHIKLLRELHMVLSDADRHREIAIVYQPQVNIETRELTGLEALLRWTHPQWGPIPTDQLIEAVEPSEVMHELTRHVLRSVLAQMQRWNAEGETFRVSVNVSVQDLHQPDFANEISKLIRRYGVAPEFLLVEITESALISDVERVSNVARTLAAQGIGLSLDDFGTGYASLQQLRQLPLTEVKIDQSYVRGITHDPADEAILTSVHQLAQALHISVVAEGVEDQRTADALAKLPGIKGQGWYFGSPMTVDDLRRWYRSVLR
jgi:EAL domain-containing protein (putative c-di-GMP-specific phosphodiesterase class I)/GGDEF domain-containing protein